MLVPGLLESSCCVLALVSRMRRAIQTRKGPWSARQATALPLHAVIGWSLGSVSWLDCEFARRISSSKVSRLATQKPLLPSKQLELNAVRIETCVARKWSSYKPGNFQ